MLRAAAPARRSWAPKPRALLALVVGAAVLGAIALGSARSETTSRPSIAFASTSTFARPVATVAPATTARPVTTVAPATTARPATTVAPTTTLRDPTDAFCAALARSHRSGITAGPYVDEFARMAAEAAGRSSGAAFATALAQLQERLAAVGPSATVIELYGDLLVGARAGDPFSVVTSYVLRCGGR